MARPQTTYPNGDPRCQICGILIPGHPRCKECSILVGTGHLEPRLVRGKCPTCATFLRGRPRQRPRRKNIRHKIYRQLSDAEVREIRVLLARRELTQTAIATLYDVTPSTVTLLKQRITHREVV